MDNAELVSSQFPPALGTASAGEARIALRNTGTDAWTRAAGYRLGAVDDFDPFYKRDTRVDLPDGAEIRPGETFEFQFALQAPAAPGSYHSNWQMIREGVSWFGPTVAADIAVTGDHVVDATTLDKKLLMGYQGWFGCRGDGSVVNDWQHWSERTSPGAESVRVDLWPDTRDYDADELFDTQFRFPDGSPARVFSSYNAKTIRRHFGWMKQYGIDGVSIGRFTVGVNNPVDLQKTLRQLEHVRQAAEEHGRVFFIAYDITGHNEATLIHDIERDWVRLVDEVRITDSPSYLRHHGQPLLMLWGLAAENRPGGPEQAIRILRFFQQNGNARHRATIMGGVPTTWRQLGTQDPSWADVFRLFDVICPWMVNQFTNEADAVGWYRNVFVGDVDDCRARSAGYVATVFPGFSWRNVETRNGRPQPPPLNEVPRHGGRFYWRQVYEAVQAGSTAVLCAMFDECDEGTAMFKVAESRAQAPVGCGFVTLDADGQALPSDWYLRLAGETGRMLRGEVPATDTIPISP